MNRLYPKFKEVTVLAEKADGTKVRLLFKNDEPVIMKHIRELLENKKDGFKDMNYYSTLNINYNEFEELELLLIKEKAEYTTDYLNKAL